MAWAGGVRHRDEVWGLIGSRSLITHDTHTVVCRHFGSSPAGRSELVCANF